MGFVLRRLLKQRWVRIALVVIAVVILWKLRGLSAASGADADAGAKVDVASLPALEAEDVTAADEARTGEILVELRDGVSLENAQADARAAGLSLDPVDADSPDSDELYVAETSSPSQEDQALSTLRGEGDVLEAEPDLLYALPAGEQDDETAEDAALQNLEMANTVSRTLTPQRGTGGAPNDPLYYYQWHLTQIGVEKAWTRSEGEGVTVAVIDTGVSYENRDRFHQVPDLAGVDIVSPWNFVDKNDHADDDHGHGTHVAGTIAQATNNAVGVAGVAYRARLMPLKVLSANGSGSVGNIAAALRYAADHGAGVANLSLGGRFPSRVLARAVEYAHDHGVVVVCAAGNDGSGRVGFPAAYPGAIAVAATQLDGKTTFYSNWGREIDLAAPGGNTREDANQDGMPDGVVQNTIVIGDPSRDDYLPFMGTSMASPHVAGVAALVEATGVTNPDEVERILKDTARLPDGVQKGDYHYGAGVVDAAAAVGASSHDTELWSLGIASILTLLLATRKRRSWQSLGGAIPGLLLGGSGLFFLRGLWPSSLPHLRDLFSTPLAQAPATLLGEHFAGDPISYSAALPLVAFAIFWGVKRARPLLAGLALGTAGLLFAQTIHSTVTITWLHAFAPVWLVANGALLALLASLALSPE
jgi:serine protease